MHRTKKPVKTINLYIILTIISLVSVLLVILLSNGSLFRIFFFSDQDDSLMDFFNSLIEVHTKKPYGDFGVLYPPLANCFFYILQLFIPSSFKVTWPKDHKETLYLVGTSKDIRMNQACMVVFLLTFLLFLFLFIILIQKFTKDRSNPLVFCLLFSHGMIQILEHGNVIIIAFVFALIFYMFHDSENPVIKEIALISLAVSFGFKLYPAFLGIILLKKRLFKEAFRAIIYGIVLTILPMMFLDGFSGFSLWINNVFLFGTDPSSKIENILRILSIIICIVVLIYDTFFANSKHLISLKESQSVMIICWLMILISGNIEGSTLLFIILPFLLFCKEEEHITRYNIAEFIVYMSCLLPIGINKLEYFFLPVFILCCFVGSKDNKI